MERKIVIVDIDGTISKVGDRIKYLLQKPKDWDAFYADNFQDEPIEKMIDLVRSLSGWGLYRIVFCTGRRESCREETGEWLVRHLGIRIIDAPLLMRPNRDKRHDTELKPELLDRAGIALDDVAFILEDRNVMVQKWRELGFTCLQVADGDF